jgi:hypothetical protein
MPYNAGVSTGFYRPYLQPMPGLGSYQRDGLAIILGGPRAGAGSGVRIYNYLNSRNQLYTAKANIQKVFKSRQYELSTTYRNYLMSSY